MASIKEKIEKLLALAQSPNENEAKAALLKAKELMARNKLTEEDFEHIKKQELSTITCDKVMWTTDSGKIWMVSLCSTLCDEYCCVAAWRTPHGSRSHTLTITGLSDDVQVAKSMVEFAVGFVDGRIKVLQRKYPSREKSIMTSYAQGFLEGLKMAFDLQKDEHPEWGLVVVKSEEVKKYGESLGVKSVRTRQDNTFDPLAYTKGQTDGQNFTKTKVIGG